MTRYVDQGDELLTAAKIFKTFMLLDLNGVVGSGETSLINSLLGNMVTLKGSVSKIRNAAYVPQLVESTRRMDTKCLHQR